MRIECAEHGPMTRNHVTKMWDCDAGEQPAKCWARIADETIRNVTRGTMIGDHVDVREGTANHPAFHVVIWL